MITTDTPAPTAAALSSRACGILALQARHIAAATAGVIADHSAHHVHDARVALRRARCALKFFPVFACNRACRGLRTRLGHVQEALGHVRDYDVLLNVLGEQCARVAAEDTDFRAIENALRSLRAQPLDALCAILTSSSFQKTTTALAALARPSTSCRVPEDADAMVALAAGKTLKQVRTWSRTDSDGDANAHLHLLRIRVRRLRYICEFLLTARPAQFKKAIAECIKLQDILGRYQDACTAIRLLTTAAASLHSQPAALLACGALIQVHREIMAAQCAAFDRFWPAFLKRVRHLCRSYE